MKWWIISRHEGYIFSTSLLSEKRYPREDKWEGELRNWIFPSPRINSFSSTKESAFLPSMIWLNGTIFLFCKNTKIRNTLDSKFLACERDYGMLIRSKNFLLASLRLFSFDLMFLDQEKNWRYLSCISNLRDFSLYEKKNAGKTQLITERKNRSTWFVMSKSLPNNFLTKLQINCR